MTDWDCSGLSNLTRLVLQFAADADADSRLAPCQQHRGVERLPCLAWDKLPPSLAELTVAHARLAVPAERCYTK